MKWLILKLFGGVFYQRRAFLVAQTVKKQPVMWETWVQSLGREEPLEKGMATHSSIQCSCLENPHGQRSPSGYSPWGGKESDRTEVT